MGLDKGSEFYNRPMKFSLKDKGIEIYLHIMKENLLLLKHFFKTLKNEIYKHMTSISKNVCIDKLDETVNKYNNTQ